MPLQQTPISRAGQAALLTWVNTFPLDRHVENLEDMADGAVFAQMLHDLDPEYDPSELEQNAGSSAWLTHKRNIQSVFKALTKYIIHKDSSGTIDFLPRTVDVRAISDSLNAEGIAQLVAIFTTAAMLGEHNTKYIPVMRTNLSTSEQAEIMTILQRKDEQRQELLAGEDGHADAGYDDDAGDTDSRALGEASKRLDPGLVAEAQLATLASDYDRLSKRLADSNTRFEYLQISYEALKDDLERKEKELDLERSKHGASESQMIRDLYEKIREQDDLIGNQEAQLEDERTMKQRLQQENTQLARKAALVETLQDQVQELKHANEDLSKKANTVDRYKQKLEAQRGLETDLQNALYELSQNKEVIREHEVLLKRANQHQLTIERFREMVSGLEQQIEDNRIQKTMLEGDIYASQVQLETLKEQNQFNEARILELEQQVLHGGSMSGSGVPGSPSGKGKTFNLEDELQNTDDPAAAYTLEINRLRNENMLLRGNASVGSENDRLRADMEILKVKEEQSRTKYNTLFEKHTLLEAQMKALTETGGVGGSVGNSLLIDTQRKLQETAAELERSQAQVRELEAQAADHHRDMLRLRADLGDLDHGSADGLLAESLTKELASLRKDYRDLQIGNEQQQKQLIEALVSREELRKQMSSGASAAGSSTGSTGTEDDKVTKEKYDKLRAASKVLKSALEAVEQERAELKKQVKALSSGGPGSGSGSGSGASAGALAKTQKELAAKDQMIRNLQRELALMTTAWYDVTSRLQTSSVSLQRRQDMPKSWLNKQRYLVNVAPTKERKPTQPTQPRQPSVVLPTMPDLPHVPGLGSPSNKIQGTPKTPAAQTPSPRAPRVPDNSPAASVVQQWQRWRSGAGW